MWTLQTPPPRECGRSRPSVQWVPSPSGQALVNPQLRPPDQPSWVLAQLTPTLALAAALPRSPPRSSAGRQWCPAAAGLHVCTRKIQKFTTKIQKPTTKIQVIWIARDCSIRLYYERLLLRTFLSFRMYPRKPTPPENYFLSGS